MEGREELFTFLLAAVDVPDDDEAFSSVSVFAPGW